jgi:hypothetical protein
MPYPADSAFRESTLRLLGSTWAKLPSGIANARAWGADWCDRSEPFVRFDGAEAIAHVGVLEVPVVLDGRAVTLAGIHAVCTHVAHRGRGHLRGTMLRALEWVDRRYEAAILWANDPAIYGRFGFVARAESVFRARVGSLGDERRVRVLSLDNPTDLALLRARIESRAPVSRTCGTKDSDWLYLINLALWGSSAPTIALAAELDAIVVYELRDRVLRLYDVIARSMPTLDTLLPFMGGGFDSVDVFFTPDALDAPTLEAMPTPLVDFLMVRGDVLTSSAPFAISPLSHC